MSFEGRHGRRKIAGYFAGVADHPPLQLLTPAATLNAE
jgi:hypothetical protein